MEGGGSSKRGGGSKKRGGGSGTKKIRPKVRANLGEPDRFRLQDEPDQVPLFQTQQFPPFQTQQYPPFQSQTYHNQPFVPPFQPHQFQSQTYQTQPHALDPLLEDNTLLHHFAKAWHEPREPQQSVDEDEEEEEEEEAEENEEEEEEEQNVEVQEIVPIGRQPWTSEEEVSLTKAYLHISESRKHGNEQRKEAFWRRVIAHFMKLPGARVRNMDKMTSKWSDLNRKMSRFNACFIQKSRNPQSGASEATIMQQATEMYCTTYHKRTFPHVAAWQVARHHPKWVPVELVDTHGPTAPKNQGGSKRTKTSDSGNYTTSASDNLPQMNLNDEPLDEPLDEPVEENTPTRPRRRRGGDSSSKGKEAVAESIFRIEEEKMTQYKMAEQRKETMMTLKVEREQAYKEHLKTIERQNDLKILCEKHAHLDEPFKSIVIEQKRAICAKWGWEMPSV
ncbi:uncharacterized protein LOC110901138 [Helianthus annuus]|uniref:uncharacterized protein LOC110901138 n=2 Tax=Helianthus annuus TaxID=4232 RepID=UPI0016530EFF|nr:uncharacterized protein LOC110901138 [Helianthus annuus]